MKTVNILKKEKRILQTKFNFAWIWVRTVMHKNICDAPGLFTEEEGGKKIVNQQDVMTDMQMPKVNILKRSKSRRTILKIFQK